jgi:SAM-dependent methyltransferase
MSPREGRTETADQVSSPPRGRFERSTLSSRDVFGRIVYDYHRDRLREAPAYLHPDGRVTAADPARHFRAYDRWSRVERAALDHAEGQVLDLCCGAGRHAVWLQDEGHDVLGVDSSPGAVRTARERGLEHAAVGDMSTLAVDRGTVDTVLLLGTGFGVCDYPVGMRSVLADLYAVTSRDGRVVVDLEDPREVERADAVDRWDGDDSRQEVLSWPDDGPATYARRWFRVHYGEWTGEWTRVAMLTPPQFRAVVAGTRWRIREVVRDRTDPRYALVLEK